MSTDGAPGRRTLSARARILGMTVTVVGLALLGTVVLLRQVLLSELDDRVERALEQEVREFAESLDGSAVGAGETPDEFVRRNLENYLRTNVAGEHEVFIGAVRGTVFAQSRNAPADITADVADLARIERPTRTERTSAAGEVRILAQPVIVGNEAVGALIVGFFVADERSALDSTIRDASTVALASLVAAIALAWIVAGRVLRPIRLVADTARDITEHDITRRIPDPGSAEIASLIRSFNSMLDRLQSGAENQRRFLDDAGHELRTPLTIMRGHIELAASDPQGMGDSAPIVLAELDRMGRIVDDLLTMARADQGAGFLHTAPIDLDEFVPGLAALVEPLGDHDWQIDEIPIGIVHADRDRLTQAILNLSANAARHTPCGQRIGIGGRLAGGRLRLWVADTGEGIDPADHARIFERFRRTETTRSAGGAAGLGLAIVKTIAEAHGGSIELDSRLGAGATFTIVIPADDGPHDGDPDASGPDDDGLTT